MSCCRIVFSLCELASLHQKFISLDTSEVIGQCFGSVQAKWRDGTEHEVIPVAEKDVEQWVKITSDLLLTAPFGGEISSPNSKLTSAYSSPMTKISSFTPELQ